MVIFFDISLEGLALRQHQQGSKCETPREKQ